MHGKNKEKYFSQLLQNLPLDIHITKAQNYTKEIEQKKHASYKSRHQQKSLLK
jgi:hypothetical protein